MVVGIISLFIYVYFPEKLADEHLRALLNRTQSIAKMTSYTIAPALFFDDRLAAFEVLASARQNVDIVYLVVLDDSGRVFIAHGLEKGERDNFRRPRADPEAVSDQGILLTTTPVIHDRRIIGRVCLGMSLASVRAQINTTQKTILLVSFLVFVVGVALVYGLTTMLTSPLAHMVETVRRITSGDLTQRASVSSRDEVGELASAFNEMVANLASAQQQLRDINAELEKRVEDRTEQLVRSEEALRRSGEHLRALSTHLQRIREEERTYIAREIHDELGQTLTAMNIDLAVVEKQLLKADTSTAVTQAIQKMRALSQLVEATIQKTRRLALELRPDVLDSLGLEAALEWQAREFQRRTNIQCDLQLQRTSLKVDEPKSTAIFRIFQESLTNIVRHAEATKIEIRLEEAGGVLILEIRDNGKGINQSDIAAVRSLGIIGMRERASSLGGDVRIHGIPGEGTRVIVEIPLHGADKEQRG
jgi:signal transduction histidine kinase